MSGYALELRVQDAVMHDWTQSSYSQASENLGMAMIYTLVSSAKDWLSEQYGQEDGAEFAEEEAAKEDEVLLPAHYLRSISCKAP